MEKLTEVLEMGGYGAYVWPAFACAALIMAALTLVSLRALARARRVLLQLERPSSDEA